LKSLEAETSRTVSKERESDVSSLEKGDDDEILET
jgi:hypothetical protein